MATGETFASLSFAVRISPSYISQIFKELLKNLKIALVPILMPIPKKVILGLYLKAFGTNGNSPIAQALLTGST